MITTLVKELTCDDPLQQQGPEQGYRDRLKHVVGSRKPLTGPSGQAGRRTPLSKNKGRKPQEDQEAIGWFAWLGARDSLDQKISLQCQMVGQPPL